MDACNTTGIKQLPGEKGQDKPCHMLLNFEDPMILTNIKCKSVFN